jgi:iron complex transport system ATP-binding protein
VLELEDVGFGYDRRRWVFRHVSFTVPAGTATAVLGPNGRGKTTLVRCAAGLLEPREGTVRREPVVGFVPQARGSAFAYRVLDMVVMGRAARLHPFASPGRRDVEAALDAMDRVGISGMRDRQFPTLSGGEQQLVLIARAVAADRSALVLDEPSTALDLHNQARVVTLLRELVADGMAVLLTTHHPDHALALANDVVLMAGPDDVRVGPAAELLTDAVLSRLYGVELRTAWAADGSGLRTIAARFGSPDGRRPSR